MRRTLSSFIIAACLLMIAALSDPFESAAQRKPAAQTEKGKPEAKPTAAKPKPAATPADEAPLKAELDEVLQMDAATRVERLTAFVKANPDSPQTLRAQELLTSARAGAGDEKLRGGGG